MKFIILISLVVLTGCGSLYTKQTDPATGQISYPLSSSTSNTIYQIEQGIKAVPDEIPYAPIGKNAALGVLTLVSGALALYGKTKSNAANSAAATAATQQQAADLLAATVVKSGQQSTALSVASGTSALSAVSQHLDNNTV